MGKSYAILIENVKELLRERGWTQEKLGDEAGLRQETISYLLRGKNIPTLETVDKLSAAFNVSTVELLTDGALSDRTKEPTAPYSAKRNKEVVFTKYGKNSKVSNVTITIPHHQRFRDEFIDFNFDKSKPKSANQVPMRTTWNTPSKTTMIILARCSIRSIGSPLEKSTS
ncbi:helix-turn-helix domain-containing protein [Enterococcus casseliflavus]|uniref:helix-turn-helix domain-containing protein n=1 Tax=Enterococcus casseliflavus TaxID=37734 RepID=UPI0035E23CC3